VCIKENCRNELLQFLEENYFRIRVASGIHQKLRVDITGIQEKQTEQERSIKSNKNQMETNRQTPERKQDDSTRVLTNHINNLLELDRQQQKIIETLKNDLQNNNRVRYSSRMACGYNRDKEKTNRTRDKHTKQ
jgi:hypothetical protein